jgi:hypothetical protein
MTGTSHRSFLIRVSTAAAALALVCVAENASAFEFGAGLVVQAGGNFISKPDAVAGIINPNPGFGGLTLGGGLMLDARLIPFLGLEVDVLRTNDKGSGDYTLNGNKFHITLSQGAWHIPILAKVVLPSPLLAPYAVLGPEYVSPSDPSAETDPKIPIGNGGFSAFADSYWMITAGLGMEIKLPLPIVDLRIPISLRASFTPGASSKGTDRTKLDAGTISYSSEWQYAINLNAGAAIYF